MRVSKINQSTIISLATPGGKSALAIVRCSGPKVKEIIKKFFPTLNKKLPEPNKSKYLEMTLHGNNLEEIIDDVVIIYYEAPRSYSGEDMLEIICHGSPVIYDTIIDEICKLDGCKHAKPGEYSLRAFENDKIDLIQAEAIAALISFDDKKSVLFARGLISGEMKKSLESIDKNLLNLRSSIESYLDFSEEDFEPKDLENIRQELTMLFEKIRTHSNMLKQGKLSCDKPVIAVMGRPNAGKSSISNHLCHDDASIVSPEPGTTRDVVTSSISILGQPFLLKDTAGIRNSKNKVEELGIQKSIQCGISADIILYIVDASIGLNHEDDIVLQSLESKKDNIIYVINKIDLAHSFKPEDASKNIKYIKTSAKQNEGLDSLKKDIVRLANNVNSSSSRSIFLTRQIDCFHNIISNMPSDGLSLANLDIYAECLRRAHENMGYLLGEQEKDRVLGEIFSNFCIGK